MENPNEVGFILKTEREQRGLTLDVIQEATKIPIDSLKAIEEGYKIRTLTSFYYKSFVRLYARHLGLDPLPILAKIPSYQAVKKEAAVDKPVALKKPDLSKFNITAGPIKMASWKKFVPVIVFVVAVAIVVGLVGAAFKFVTARKTAGTQKITSQAEKDNKSRKVVKVEKVVQSERVNKTEKVEKIVKAATVESRAVEPVVEPRKPAVEPAVSNAAAEVKPVVSRVTLTVRATVTAWLTVKSDGSTVFKGSLKKGMAESWSATKKIEISGKEVDQLEYEVNGKTIGKLSRRDTKARRVIITPEGLSVEK